MIVQFQITLMSYQHWGILNQQFHYFFKNLLKSSPLLALCEGNPLVMGGLSSHKFSSIESVYMSGHLHGKGFVMFSDIFLNANQSCSTWRLSPVALFTPDTYFDGWPLKNKKNNKPTRNRCLCILFLMDLIEFLFDDTNQLVSYGSPQSTFCRNH